MKKAITLFALLTSLSSFARVNEIIADPAGHKTSNNLSMIRNQLGSGTPAPIVTIDTQSAVYVDDGYYHIPQYLPNYPTAATIWARAVEVDCHKAGDDGNKLVCNGYHWTPSLGRAEYIMIVPKVRKVLPSAPPMVIMTKEIKEVPVIVYKEVPVKKKAE